jgi:hypothetical protein
MPLAGRATWADRDAKRPCRPATPAASLQEKVFVTERPRRHVVAGFPSPRGASAGKRHGLPLMLLGGHRLVNSCGEMRCSGCLQQIARKVHAGRVYPVCKRPLRASLVRICQAQPPSLRFDDAEEVDARPSPATRWSPSPAKAPRGGHVPRHPFSSPDRPHLYPCGTGTGEEVGRGRPHRGTEGGGNTGQRSCRPCGRAPTSHCRSRVRYWMASATCAAVISSAPARSAMVRATLQIRSCARALSP